MSDLTSDIIQALHSAGISARAAFALPSPVLPMAAVQRQTAREALRADGAPFASEQTYLVTLMASEKDALSTLLCDARDALSALGFSLIEGDEQFDEAAYAYSVPVQCRALVVGDTIYQ